MNRFLAAVLVLTGAACTRSGESTASTGPAPASRGPVAAALLVDDRIGRFLALTRAKAD